MQILTPFDLVNLWPEGRSMVIVGNAPSLQNEGLGPLIDSHDIVVRFNDCPTTGFEADVGRKTTILVSNPYPEGRQPPRFNNPDDAIIFIIAPQTRRGDDSIFRDWVGDIRVFFTYSPDLVQVGDIGHKATLTTGTYATHLLPRLLKPTRILICGFTMFLADTAFHYFSPLIPSGVKGHDLAVEAKLFIKICNSIHCPTSITEEIAWVAKKTHLRLARHVSIS